MSDEARAHIARHTQQLESGCLLWSGPVVGQPKAGHPVPAMCLYGERMSVRAVIHYLDTGTLIRRGQFRPKCKNRRCVAAEHTKVPLIDSDVTAIITRVNSGENHHRIAADYGISRETVTRLGNGTRI